MGKRSLTLQPDSIFIRHCEMGKAIKKKKERKYEFFIFYYKISALKSGSTSISNFLCIILANIVFLITKELCSHVSRVLCWII